MFVNAHMLLSGQLYELEERAATHPNQYKPISANKCLNTWKGHLISTILQTHDNKSSKDRHVQLENVFIDTLILSCCECIFNVVGGNAQSE